MPPVSLVVCVRHEPDLLQRLLQHAAGTYDDLVVIHDGPDTNSETKGIVENARGRFFERPLQYQQEPHWPFGWQIAAHDWILRLDADEFPSDEMKSWLDTFRRAPEPPTSVSGFTCYWPLWSGRRTVSKKWPAGRNFLFHRQRVRFFGMNEQTPIPDGRYEPLELVLHHQPRRKSYGFRNILTRKQAYRWRLRLAQSLIGKPTDLIGWRWESAEWPATWEQIRRGPWRAVCITLTLGVFRGLRDQWRTERRFFPVAALAGPIHRALTCVDYWRLSLQQKRGSQSRKAPSAQNG